MYSAPWTDVGRIQQDLDVIKSQLYGKANSYELSEINHKVGNLEHSLRQLSTEVDGFRQRMQDLEARLELAVATPER